ncbi:hypothetical protein M407DRAFT_241470 [Tulasnella calospora MUT 4182]|uniref:Uncharacterized protein n=1 Tax=Tulasnella calospora MUT 4182 TaxID=1051891 RepID=A0A0C3QV29_9AGAM|nr:hypothetical protein M407DRAFT_241470 [Tulasnella calospora MUT 4182]
MCTPCIGLTGRSVFVGAGEPNDEQGLRNVERKKKKGFAGRAHSTGLWTRNDNAQAGGWVSNMLKRIGMVGGRRVWTPAKLLFFLPSGKSHRGSCKDRERGGAKELDASGPIQMHRKPRSQLSRRSIQGRKPVPIALALRTPPFASHLQFIF